MPSSACEVVRDSVLFHDGDAALLNVIRTRNRTFVLLEMILESFELLGHIAPESTLVHHLRSKLTAHVRRSEHVRASIDLILSAARPGERRVDFDLRRDLGLGTRSLQPVLVGPEV